MSKDHTGFPGGILDIESLRQRASAATTCVACEGSPSAENNPCAVCGSAATVGESNTTDDDAFVWLETEISAVDCRYRGDPSYDHDAYWMRERVLKLVKEAKGIFGKAAQQQAQPECPRCGLTVSPESCDCAEARAVRTKQQAEPGADEWAEFETALKQYAEACHRSESCSAMDAARARVCAIFSRAAQSGQRAGAVNTRAAAMLRWVTHVLDDIIRTDSDYREGSRLNLGSERDRFKRALHKLHEAQALLAAAPTQQPSTDQS